MANKRNLPVIRWDENNVANLREILGESYSCRAWLPRKDAIILTTKELLWGEVEVIRVDYICDQLDDESYGKPLAYARIRAVETSNLKAIETHRLIYQYVVWER